MPARIHLNKQPVENDVPEKYQEIVKQTVDIIVAMTENIKYRDQFDHDIPFQIVPVRIAISENSCIAPFITGGKNVGKIFPGVGKQELIFFPGVIIGIPVVVAGAINMYRNPANGNPRKYLNKKKAQQNSTAYSGILYKRHPQNSPT
jgi:hypothetical protein